MLAFLTFASPSFAQQKTVKACEDEWRAKRAENQKAGITEKAYVEKCRGQVCDRCSDWQHPGDTAQSGCHQSCSEGAHSAANSDQGSSNERAHDPSDCDQGAQTAGARYSVCSHWR